MSVTERPFIDTWTAETAVTLQRAFRMTNDAFAEHLDIAVRTVAGWHSDRTIVPRNQMQRVLDDAYEGARQAVVERFAHLLQRKGEPVPAAPKAVPAAPTPSPHPQPAPAADPVVAQMAADMALMQARIDSLQEQLGAIALRLLT
ncbi:hypothetical protein NRF20_20755 [Streptomyces sp. R-74717]|uniref:hypothetical protein n=1 Tax=Streptomyces sp. R-74717 TaxID=2969820 RepID=UPI0039B6AE42